MSEDTVLPIPNLKLPQALFILKEPQTSNELKEKAKKEFLEGIERDEMAPYLETLLADPTFLTLLQSVQPSSSSSASDLNGLLSKLKDQNKKELERLDEKLADAEKNLGETEIVDVLKSKATYLAKIGENEKALEAHEEALKKTAGLGSKIDIRLSMARIGFFFGDHPTITSNLKAATALVEEGGDWDRRNRLSVYSALHQLSIRNFKEGCKNLLESISTFTATELIDYEDFIVLSVIVGQLELERKQFKQKIIESSEVLQIIPQVPVLKDFTSSLYNAEYSKFFRSLIQVEEQFLIPSRLLAVHTRYYMREMRIKAYSQLLESYRSVTINNLCQAFGISQEMLEADLCRFIASGRLPCSIDKVKGIVVTNRSDSKNYKYEQVIKQGDIVLNNIQKLSRALPI